MLNNITLIIIALLCVGCTQKTETVKVAVPGSWEELREWCDSAHFDQSVNYDFNVALRSRYESEKRKIEEKMKGMCK